jgi:hypothetical protein
MVGNQPLAVCLQPAAEAAGTAALPVSDEEENHKVSQAQIFPDGPVAAAQLAAVPIRFTAEQAARDTITTEQLFPPPVALRFMEVTEATVGVLLLALTAHSPEAAEEAETTMLTAVTVLLVAS